MYRINEINPHPGAHLDEALQRVIIEKYGSHIYQGADTAVVVPKQLDGAEDAALANGHLPLGQLGGTLDDKDGNGKRLPDTCCALRTAEHLGVDGLPELGWPLKAVTRVDGNAMSGKAELGFLMKLMNDSLPQEAHARIFNMMCEAMRAVIHFRSNPKSEPSFVLLPGLVFEAIVKERLEYGEPIQESVVNEIRRRIRSSHSQRDVNCIELCHIPIAMSVAGRSHEDILEWTHFVIDKWIQQQENYWTAHGEIRKNGKFVLIPGMRDQKILFILSDNPQVNGASRHLDFKAAITIIRKSTGNVAIIPNLRHGFDMSGVWALIRMWETPYAKRANALFEEYIEDGNHPNAPHWHMMPGGTALNGSNYQTARPTRMDDDTIIGIVIDGLFLHGARNRFYKMAGRKMPAEDKRTIHSGDRIVAKSYLKRRSATQTLGLKHEPHTGLVQGEGLIVDKRALSELEKSLDGSK